MNLKGRLLQDMNEALKARESGRQRLSVLRLLRAAVRNAEIAAGVGADFDDQAVLSVLAREANRLQEDAAEYRRLGRPVEAARLEEELAIVRSYLPAQLSEAEVLDAVRQAVAETGAAGPQDLGRVMKVLMPLLRGRAGGKLISELVRRVLSGGG